MKFFRASKRITKRGWRARAVNRVALLLLMGLCPLLFPGPNGLASLSDDPALLPARRARDQGDLATLRGTTEIVRLEASNKNSFEGYLRLALFDDWICEAAYDHQDNRLVKQAAQAGIAAAREAVKLNPNSSDAHWLLSELLGKLIPHVLGGGPRFGPESTREAEKAIELDPKNPGAYIARALDYFFTPSMFGGSKPKAIAMLEKAVEIDPASDAANTAHVFLAQAYFDLSQRDNALREIQEALRSNPERRWTRYVNQQITPGKKE
jgi:tetratricopeptide (TPR) repeat protein